MLELSETDLKKYSKKFDISLIQFFSIKKPLKNLCIFEKCVNLKALDLKNCQLKVVHPFGFLKDLIYVDFSLNNLWDIRGLSAQKNLMMIKLEGNNIEKISQLEILQNCRNLKFLSLKNLGGDASNPICQSKNYSEKISKVLPQLVYLDYQRVNDQKISKEINIEKEMSTIIQEIEKKLEFKKIMLQEQGQCKKMEIKSLKK